MDKGSEGRKEYHETRIPTPGKRTLAGAREMRRNAKLGRRERRHGRPKEARPRDKKSRALFLIASKIVPYKFQAVCPSPREWSSSIDHSGWKCKDRSDIYEVEDRMVLELPSKVVEDNVS